MAFLREHGCEWDMDAATLRCYSPDQVRAAEEATGELLRNGTLMQRAASALADVIATVVRERDAHSVVVLVGPGHNGGDALFAAAKLAREHDVRPVVVLCSQKAHEGGLAAVRDAGLDILQHPQGAHTECGGEHCDGPDSLKAVAYADVIVDGVLGIGAQARMDNPWGSVLREFPATAYVIAVDCPTPGVRANRTVTFGAMKTSLVLEAGAGDIDVIDIGLENLGRPEAVRPGVLHLAMKWPVPGPHDHKYTRGVVGMATGSNAYPGAAVLGTVAAATAGAGMVRYLGPTRPCDAVLAAVPEAVHGEGRVQAWVIGSGIDGVSERDKGSDRYESALGVCGEDSALVIDAGALTWLDDIERPEGSVTVLTPHAGELAGVLKTLGVSDEGDEVTREAIEAAPLRWAQEAADASGYVILLKGGVSVIASPGEEGSQCGKPAILLENRAPNWLATAGTGDVLAGILGVALAAGLEPDDACAAAAFLHGRAAHLANPGGPVRALDVATHLGRAITELVSIQQTFKQQLRNGDARDPALVRAE